jgi:hypothetical protein
MTTKPGFFGKYWEWLLGAVCLVVALALAYHFRQGEREESLNVPLGVEQAAIVTYSGPPVTVAPYKWGVAVNVRIANVSEQPGARIYDIRYIVNRGGTFDLKDYLTSTDGAPLTGLPSFKFHGDPKLSRDLDARIQETEEVAVTVGGHYYATLVALGLFWIVWLLLLIFWKRPKKAAALAPPPPQPSLSEKLRALLAQLENGTLDAAGKARLEMLFLRRWREELAAPDLTMTAAFEAIDRSDKTGETLRRLQHWLHHPASPVQREEIAAALAPFTAEPALPQPARRP